MNAREQQILQPTCQKLRNQQQGLKFCITFKSTLFFLNLCYVIQLFTKIHLKCQAIGISILIIYFVTVKYNFQDSFFTYLLKKSTKLQKMFITMIVILIFQIKYVSFITPAICLVCYACYFYQIIYSEQNQLRQYQKNILVISLLAVVQWQIIVLKIQEYVDYEWSSIVAGMSIGMIMLLILLGIMTLYILCSTPRNAEYDDQYYQSNWYNFQQKGTFYAIFIVYLGYLSIFIALLQVYISEEVYKYILLTIFTLTVIEMLLYTIRFKKLVVLFLGYNAFAEMIVVRLKNGHFRSIYEIKQRQYIKNQEISIHICYNCDKQANVVHKTCENITLCLECFQQCVVVRKRSCLKCKSYSLKYNYYYTCSRQKLRLSPNQSIRNISNYLEQGEYISVNL